MTVTTWTLSRCRNFDIIGIFQPGVHLLNWLTSLAVLYSRALFFCERENQPWRQLPPSFLSTPHSSVYSTCGNARYPRRQWCSQKSRGYVGPQGLCLHVGDGYVNKRTHSTIGEIDNWSSRTRGISTVLQCSLCIIKNWLKWGRLLLV